MHKDKLVRMGVPIYNSHTVLSANGKEEVESITIAQVDKLFRPIYGTEKSFSCDTLLIAVGLDPVNEFTVKAQEYGLPVFSAGDAHEIAEASAAIFSGRIIGLEVAQALGFPTGEIPHEWYRMGEILKSRPGKNYLEAQPEEGGGVAPVIHCTQEIPCNPCSSLCPNCLIEIKKVDIRQIPYYLGNNYCLPRLVNVVLLAAPVWP